MVTSLAFSARVGNLNQILPRESASYVLSENIRVKVRSHVNCVLLASTQTQQEWANVSHVQNRGQEPSAKAPSCWRIVLNSASLALLVHLALHPVLHAIQEHIRLHRWVLDPKTALYARGVSISPSARKAAARTVPPETARQAREQVLKTSACLFASQGRTVPTVWTLALCAPLALSHRVKIWRSAMHAAMGHT